MIRGINRALPSSAPMAGGWNQFVGLTFERSEENVVPIRKVSIDSAGRSTTSIEDLHVDIIITAVLYQSETESPGDKEQNRLAVTSASEKEVRHGM